MTVKQPVERAAQQHSLVRTQLELERSALSTDSASEKPEFDENYNVISVLYHALRGAETYERYAQDAQLIGDAELAEFFKEVHDEEVERAIRARQLLFSRWLEEDELIDHNGASAPQP